MANTTSTKIELTFPKKKLRKLKKFLEEEGGEIVAQRKESHMAEPKGSITQGSHQTSEKPSDFAGIWKNDDRNIEDMRRRAWDNRGIKW
ncbi:MAG: hypothetical protein WA958_04190 [Tunicatimonas sp.]